MTQNVLKIAWFPTKCPQAPLALPAAFSRSGNCWDIDDFEFAFGGGGGLKSYSCHNKLLSWVEVVLGVWQKVIPNNIWSHISLMTPTIFDRQFLITNLFMFELFTVYPRHYTNTHHRMITGDAVWCWQRLINTNQGYRIDIHIPFQGSDAGRWMGRMIIRY